MEKVVEVVAWDYGGLLRRSVAYVLDSLVVTCAYVLLGRLFVVLLGPMQDRLAATTPAQLWAEMSIAAKSVILLAYVLPSATYQALFESSSWQATVGKRLLNLYVVDAHGQRISISRAIARSVVKCLSAVFAIWILSALTIAGTAKKKAIHDFAADTLVLRGHPAQRASLEWWRIVGAFGVSLAAVMAVLGAVLYR